MSRNAMSKWNKFIVEKMAEIRQKNLFVFIVMPTFFDLDRTIALWRTRGLIHVYTKGESWERGYFVFYNRDLKTKLYIEGKKTYQYKGSKFNYRGRFLNYYPLDEDEYRLKKYQSLIEKVHDEPGEKKLSQAELFRLQMEKMNKSRDKKTNK